MVSQNKVNALHAVLPAVQGGAGADPKMVVIESLKGAMDSVVKKITVFGDNVELTEFEKLAACIVGGVGYNSRLDPVKNEFQISLKSPCHVRVAGGRVRVLRLMPRS
jgi:hypothetical protein